MGLESGSTSELRSAFPLKKKSCGGAALFLQALNRYTASAAHYASVTSRPTSRGPNRRRSTSSTGCGDDDNQHHPRPANHGDQPSVVTITLQALTTTFTPPPKCQESHLSMMSPPSYQIWMNEPMPVPGPANGDCYPSEFIQGYTSIANSSSSIAPFFKPLICPVGWSVAQEWENGYIVCCYDGFFFTPPETTAYPDRPGYGGTCYSQFGVGKTVPVTKYGTANVTGTAMFPATRVEDSAYGHPMDGFKVGAGSGQGKGLNGGAIAGIVIGVVLGLAAIALAVFFLLRRRKTKQAAADNNVDMPPNTASPEQPYLPKEVDGSPNVTEHSSPYTQMSPQHELQSDVYRAELGTISPYQELPGSFHGHEMRG
ncbi:Cfem domain protein [Apiospora hydei]|uniref:Cfem domain protein n=1 Tax=Apiospora hydei TaxID=1337664 RepID=A0ABR1VTR0_9PEZI